MPDTISSKRRSWVMSRVGRKNTPPEIRVRKAAHSLGLRFRLHRRDLPGNPDIVFPKHRVALFVHGCFWHRHQECGRARMPKSNVRYWSAKFRRNVARDQQAVADLASMGWTALTIWECQTHDARELVLLLERLLVREANIKLRRLPTRAISGEGIRRLRRRPPIEFREPAP